VSIDTLDHLSYPQFQFLAEWLKTLPIAQMSNFVEPTHLWYRRNSHRLRHRWHDQQQEDGATNVDANLSAAGSRDGFCYGMIGIFQGIYLYPFLTKFSVLEYILTKKEQNFSNLWAFSNLIESV